MLHRRLHLAMLITVSLATLGCLPSGTEGGLEKELAGSDAVLCDLAVRNRIRSYRGGEQVSDRPFQHALRNVAVAPDGLHIGGVNQYGWYSVIRVADSRGAVPRVRVLSDFVSSALSAHSKTVAVCSEVALGRDRFTGIVVSSDPDREPVKVEPLDKAGRCKQLALSYDGSKLAYEVAGRINVLDLRSKHRQDVGAGRLPWWSPDGKRLSYWTLEGDLIIENFEKTSHDTLLRRRNIDVFSAWSPDGRYIAFGERSAFPFPYASRISVVRVADGVSTTLGSWASVGAGQDAGWLLRIPQ